MNEGGGIRCWLYPALALVLCVAILSGTALAAGFPDVPGDASYAEAVDALTDSGIFTGDEKGLFHPDSTITRSEFAAVICRLLDVEVDEQVSNPPFSDVATSNWAVGYIAKAVELGVINGKGDGTFGPLEEVTCEQAVKMLICAVGFEDEAVDAGGWPDGYMNVAKDFGYLEGISRAGSQTMPRSDIALLFYNYMLQQRGNDE